MEPGAARAFLLVTPGREELSKLMCTVYVLWSERLQKRYIGSTRDFPKRLREHNAGKNKFTKGGIPWSVIYQEDLPDYSAARRREIFLKTGAGRAWLDELLRTKVK
jgi:predicted GIY-YIG superfamily endonuclease